MMPKTRSDMLRQIMRKFEVFRNICFVATKAAMRRVLSIMINGEYIALIAMK